MRRSEPGPGPGKGPARAAPNSGKCHKIITNPVNILSPTGPGLSYSGFNHGGIARIMNDSQTWEQGEPSVADLLSDPIVELVLRRDGLTRRDVWRAVEAARRGLNHARTASSAAA